MDERREPSTAEECCLFSGLRWCAKRCCPKRLRRFCKRIRSAFINAVRQRRRDDSNEHLANIVIVLKRKRESSSTDEEGWRDLKKRKGAANESEEQQKDGHLEDCMHRKEMVPTKRCRSEEDTIVPTKRFRRPLPMTVTSFTFHQVLGQGAFGKVMLASVPGRDSPAAVKIIPKKAIKPKYILKESRILQVARNSPFLCHGYAAFQTESCALLIMEYMAGGTLKSYLNRMGCLTEPAAAFYTAELVCGIQFLHSRGIIHRDLKPSNVLLDGEGHVKICDFGIAKDNIFGSAQTTGHCGTFEYMAPEIHLKQAYGAAVDWWSLGVMLFRMLDGALPFYDSKRPKMFIGIVHCGFRITKELTKEAVDILRDLLMKDPQRRLGMTGNIKLHPFFRTITWGDIESRRSTPPYQPEVSSDLHLNRLESIPLILQKAEDTSSSNQILSGFSFVTPDWII